MGGTCVFHEGNKTYMQKYGWETIRVETTQETYVYMGNIKMDL